MSNQDRQLAVLYWQLQRKVHTNPRVRKHLSALTRLLKKRQIQPADLNEVGLDLVAQDQF